MFPSTVAKKFPQAGFTLVELMIAMTVSMFILLTIVSMMRDVSRSHNTMEMSSQLIENGRFSVQILQDNLQHAGYYGHYFFNDIAPPAAVPDPCITNNAAALLAAMALPVQGFNALNLANLPDLSATTCGAVFLPPGNLSPGSDILVVRRAGTAVVNGAPVVGEAYLQANINTAQIQFGVLGANLPATTADGAAVTIFNRGGAVPADTREYSVLIFFVAPCSFGVGPAVSGGTCTATNDNIPTLKMLELSSVAGVTTMSISPIAEGVEVMKLSYGIDDSPTTVHSLTGLPGDGVPDSYTAAPTLAQWRDVVTVRINLLVRTSRSENDRVDTKSYMLDDIAVVPRNDGFKRHVFSSEVRLTNMAGPREIP